MNTTFQPETPNGIRLGYTVTNVTTGFSGVVIALTHYASGYWQALVQPKGAIYWQALVQPKGAIDCDAKWSEHAHLVVKEQSSYPELALDKITFPTPKFALFEPVKDTVTGVRGFIHAITYYTAGCMRYQIRSTDIDQDNRPVYFETDEVGLVTWEGQPTLATQEGKPSGGSKQRVRRHN